VRTLDIGEDGQKDDDGLRPDHPDAITEGRSYLLRLPHSEIKTIVETNSSRMGNITKLGNG
jgi:hypothetical protein